MDDPSRQSAVAIARDLATHHPTAMLPCPVCGATLRADNLDKHLQKTHPSAPPSTQRWRGTDRRAIRPLLAFAILCALGVITLQGALAIPLDPLQIALLAGMSLALTLIFLVWLGHLPAHLSLQGDALTLRYCLGLLTRTVRLPAKLEVGTLVQFRPDALTPNEVNASGEDVPIGHYLRLGDRLLIACTGDSSFRTHWNPQAFHSGPHRRSWDITVDRTAQVELEYQLAARGLLSPKPADD
jgi:hypothetical protein